MTWLLDSVIVIDYLNGVAASRDWLLPRMGDVAVSVVTRAEVLAGLSDETDRTTALRLLDALPCFDVTPEIADLAAGLRRAHRWKLPDALQAAVAMHHGLSLATRNTRDFPPERFDFVTVPYLF